MELIKAQQGFKVMTDIVKDDNQKPVSILDILRNKNRPFMTQDYFYRVQKNHPQVGLSQIQEEYDQVPISIKDLGNNTSGEYHPEGSEIFLNKNSADNSTLIHEMSHDYDQYLAPSNQKDLDYLQQAYPSDTPTGSYFTGNNKERRAVNTELRGIISQDYNNATGADLDKIIDNLSPTQLFQYQRKTGYISNPDILQTNPIKQALKNVAYMFNGNPNLV